MQFAIIFFNVINLLLGVRPLEIPVAPEVMGVNVFQPFGHQEIFP